MGLYLSVDRAITQAKFVYNMPTVYNTYEASHVVMMSLQSQYASPSHTCRALHYTGTAGSGAAAAAAGSLNPSPLITG